MRPASAEVDWSQETRLYDRPHPRLEQAARILSQWPGRRLLDVGCSTARLRDLLPADFVYFGCDIADHAQRMLPAGRFLRIDFNESIDLSIFAGARIDAIHVGGVLEYLARPGDLLRELHRIADPHSRLLVSMIQFDAPRHADPTRHHRAWIYKPSPLELEAEVQQSGWKIESRAAVRRSSSHGRWIRRACEWLADPVGTRSRRADQVYYLCNHSSH